MHHLLPSPVKEGLQQALNLTEGLTDRRSTLCLWQAPTYPSVIQNEALWVANPWEGGRGAACRVGAEGGVGLQSLVVLGDADPSRAGRGAPAWEAFLWG